MANDGAIPHSVVEKFPTTNTQFVSLLDILIRESLGHNLISESTNSNHLGILLKNSVSYELNIESNSVMESTFEKVIKEYLLSNLGIESELVNKKQPQWNMYYCTKDGKNVARFNIDIYPKEKCDALLVTFSKLEFE